MGHVVEIAFQLNDLLRCALCFAQKDADAVCCRKFLFSHAIADLFDMHDGHRAEFIREMPQQRRPGRGTQFSLYAPAVGRDTLQNMRCCGRGNRQDAVGTLHLTASHMNGRDDHTVGAERFHQQTNADNIRHCIHCADFMEMDLPDRSAVGAALRLSNTRIHGQCVRLHAVRNIQPREDLHDIPKGCVVMVVMMVVVVMLMLMVVMMVHIMALLLVTVNGDSDVCAGDAAADCGLTPDAHPFQTECIHLPDELLRIRVQLGQCSGQHVPRCAHPAFNI